MTQSQEISLSQMKQWIATNQSEWFEDFKTFLQFPSISSEPDYKQSMIECADWLCKKLKQQHFEVQLWETNGHPIVFASNLEAGPDKPTLLIYNHYDVQPVDPLEEWTSPPFEPVVREGKIYARGAQDNKGQCFYVLTALKMLRDIKGKFPINIKLCIEGEEEIGSASLSRILSEKKRLLKRTT